MPCAADAQLVLADCYERFELTYEGCHVFNPGSFRGGSFAWMTYYPATGQAQQRCVALCSGADMQRARIAQRLCNSVNV